MSASPAAKFEQRLAREGLAPLDYDDGSGGIKVGNRGSGKLLDSSRAFSRATGAEEREQRQAISQTRRMTPTERRVYRLYAKGNRSTRAIAKRTGLGRMAVWRMIVRIEARQQADAGRSLQALLASCEPTVVVLFFHLLERALEAPGEVRGLIGKARSNPELRQLLEPDELRMPIDHDDGHRHRKAIQGGSSTHFSSAPAKGGVGWSAGEKGVR